jgi:membrane protein YdbS with pleckstrin-like domain
MINVSNYNYMDVNAKKSMVLANSILLIILFLILNLNVGITNNIVILHTIKSVIPPIAIDQLSVKCKNITLFIVCSITMLFVIPTFRYKNFRYKIKNNEIQYNISINKDNPFSHMYLVILYFISEILISKCWYNE